MNRSTAQRTQEAGPKAVVAEQVKAGNVRAISRLISWLEDQHPDGAAALCLLSGAPRPALMVGVTGYPGAGKSTLIARLVAAYRQLGMKTAVLAVDASSPVTGGALLGDRIRMQDHVLDREVYIRSMATRGHQGGLARATGEATSVLRAAGYDVILIETVGVGQSEVDVMHHAHTVVAVVAPGLGDDIQAMKAGLLEMAHILVVNKADQPGADAAVRDLREWCPTVLRTVATTGEGLPELVTAIAEHQRLRHLGQESLRAEMRKPNEL